MNLTRRSMFAGLAAVIAAPAIIRTPGLLMPIKPQRIAYSSSPAMDCLADVQAWQRMVAEEIEKIVRPPMIPGLRITSISGLASERLNLLLAMKPVGA